MCVCVRVYMHVCCSISLCVFLFLFCLLVCVLVFRGCFVFLSFDGSDTLIKINIVYLRDFAASD